MSETRRGSERPDPGDGSPWKPARLADFVGQSETIESLGVSIRFANAQGKALKHVLLTGGPGLGKSTLAELVAAGLGTRIHVTSAPIIETPMQILGILSEVGERDVVFIDEIHRLPIWCQEYFYGAMLDQPLDVLVAEGGRMLKVRVVIPPFTLIGATTDEQELSEAFLSRFDSVERLEPYGAEDLVRIIAAAAARLGVAIDPEAATVIASRSRETPREALKILRRAREVAYDAGSATIEPAHALRAAKLLRIHADGLTSIDLKILEILVRVGCAVGLKTIGAMLGLNPRTIERYHEPFLLRHGWIIRTRFGRKATDKAVARIRSENDPSST